MSKEREFMETVAEETALTLGDRINFPFILAQQIITFQKAIVKEEGKQSYQEVLEAAQGLYELIPDAWRRGDQEFDSDVGKATVTINLDQRKHWCGVPIGEPKMISLQTINPYKLFHACMNLLQRRGLLARTLYTEIKTGKDYLEETKEEVASNDTTTKES